MPPSDDAPFRFQHDVEVRFRDIDVAGHTHHSLALIYFEEARAAYWRDVVGRASIDDVDYVLAEGCVRWHARIRWPQTVRVGVRVSALGRKHFRMEYEARGADGERLVSGHTVQVMYDYEAEASRRVPGEVADAIVAFEGPLPEGRVR